MDEFLNMLVGGPWYDRLAYTKLVADHVTCVRHIDPKQWKGWPCIIFDNGTYRYEGVWR